jgi:uncharacterized protein YukE
MTSAASPGGGGTYTGGICLANGVTVPSLSPLAPFSYNWIGGDIHGLQALAATLYGYVPDISNVTSTLDDQVKGLVGAAKWTGSAATAFDNAYEADATAAHGLTVLILDAGEIIDALAVALSKIESELEQAAAKAKSHGAPVGANGAPPEVCMGGTTKAEQEAGQWLSWYQTYYQAAMTDANQVRNQAAGQLNQLPVPTPSSGKGSGDWETALVAIGSGADNIAGGLQGASSAIGNLTTKASQMLRDGDPEGARIMSLLSRNGTWQNLGALGRSDAVELGGRFLLGAGAVLTAVGVYQQTHNVGEAATDAVGDTAIGWGSTWAGTETGAAIGSFIGPEGTLIGGGVGALVGAGVGFFASGEFNHLMGDIFG